MHLVAQIQLFPDGTLFIHIALILLMIYILNRTLYRPINRVLDTRISPGQTTPLHVHCWPAALYILSWSDIVRRDENGSTILDSRTTAAAPSGVALWTPPLSPHTLENVGTAELWVIAVEVKNGSN